jgi:geranylgeranyl diphosphate synthase type II
LDLDKYLEEKCALVNSALKDLLGSADTYPPVLHQAAHYSLFAGGKRLRPALVLATAEAVSEGVETIALNAACAVECIHTYSLIHDDLPALDNDDLRRGLPTCHKKYGDAMAILAGDTLLTVAFELLARTEEVDNSLIVQAVIELSSAAGSTGMIGGQVVDIESEGTEVAFPVLEYIHIHKTGKLILASVRCGAILASATEEQLNSLTRYGEAIGLAFQIADDLLDVEGTDEELGKKAGMDELRGKATYPALLGISESRRRATELVEVAVKALNEFDSKADPLRSIAHKIVSRKS